MDEEKKFVGGYVSEQLKRALQEIADQEERSVNFIFEKILTEGVKHRKASRKKPEKKAA